MVPDGPPTGFELKETKQACIQFGSQFSFGRGSTGCLIDGRSTPGHLDWVALTYVIIISIIFVYLFTDRQICVHYF